jgi:CheY-like chemotaxis protein
MKKVMIIEDDLTTQSLLSTLLGFEGYDVLVPKDLISEETIIDNIVQSQPDLILMDVHLRRGNGLSILQKIHQNPDLLSLKVIITSGEDYSYECKKIKANGFLMKPYMPDDLLQMVKRFITTNTTP